jgi:GDP-D-mannose dehydratase
MTETKETTTYSIGVTRMKYLDLANMSFAQGNLGQCKSYIDSFMDTIKEETEAGKQLKKEFDEVYLHKKNVEDAAEKKATTLGWLEKGDFEDMIRQELNFDTIHNLKSICWMACMKYGLFFE